MKNEHLIELIHLIINNPLEFGVDSPIYKHWLKELPEIINAMYKKDPEGKFDLGPIGKIQLPFVDFGSITSAELFGLDEIILFVFYWKNRNRYKIAFDLGGNIGLHSIMLAKFGLTVNTFEPDPKHIEILENNLELNDSNLVTLHPMAVYSDDQEREFVRVLGNTTGSHIAGAKDNPYGQLDRLKVKCRSFRSILLEKPSLIKMDIEGAEAEVICSIEKGDWGNTDMMMEVGTYANAEKIWRHLSAINLNMFAQKIGWQKVNSLEDLPNSYKEGSLFLTTKSNIPWI